MGCCGRVSPRSVSTPAPPALNAASAQLTAQKAFKAAADPNLILRRIELCKKCPYFAKDVCNRCGCYLVAKVGVLNERCPLQKW